MRFTARVLKIALELIIPFTLENPARSRLWICRPILAIRRRRHVVHQLVEYCSFGEAWRKSTLFLGIHIDLCPLEPHRCIGSKRGLCKFSGKPHISLTGRDSSGQWRPKTAEPYPRGLCKVLAVCFGNAEVRRIAGSFSRFFATHGDTSGLTNLGVCQQFWDGAALLWKDTAAPFSIEDQSRRCLEVALAKEKDRGVITGVHHGFDMQRRWNGRPFTSSFFSLPCPPHPVDLSWWGWCRAAVERYGGSFFDWRLVETVPRSYTGQGKGSWSHIYI